jgi:4-hydroxy-4-methyl-2-oxoglutarate aldolase
VTAAHHGVWGQDSIDTAITVPMLSDSCDRAGFRHQVLEERLAPLVSPARASGRARTIRFVADTTTDPQHPYDDAIDFIDGLSPGDLIVLATGNSNASAFWGELFSAAAQGRGAHGLVTDGNIRDSDKIMALGFPTFSRSARPVDYRGRMKVDVSNIPVVIGGVTISPGDLVVADDDGVIVIPQNHEAEILSYARERAQGESVVIQELLAGATLRDVWTAHGIL